MLATVYNRMAFIDFSNRTLVIFHWIQNKQMSYLPLLVCLTYTVLLFENYKWQGTSLVECIFVRYNITKEHIIGFNVEQLPRILYGYFLLSNQSLPVATSYYCKLLVFHHINRTQTITEI